MSGTSGYFDVKNALLVYIRIKRVDEQFELINLDGFDAC